jgi:hypothetical protein
MHLTVGRTTMRVVLRVSCAVALVAVIVTGCGFLGLNGTQDETSTGPASGTIQDIPFTFVSGYAGPSSTSAAIWNVYLYPEEPATGLEPWESGAYADVYPYVSFAFETSLVPGEFTIETYAGIADSGNSEKIGINGWLSFFDGIVFDSGTLIISEFNPEGGTVSGSINADTIQNNAKLNGTFQVSANPAE